MKTIIRILSLALMIAILAACSPAPAPNEVDIAATASAAQQQTAAAMPTMTPAPTKTETPTPAPTQTATNTPEPTLTPTEDLSAPVEGWEAPMVNTEGDYSFGCTVTGISTDVVEIIPGVDATGFLICGDYQIPAGIYDRNNNVLYYWELGDIVNPKLTDHLGHRAMGRLCTVFGIGDGSLAQYNNLIGKKVMLSIGLPSSKNMKIFDVTNAGQFTDEYYGDRSALDNWAQTGRLPIDKNILYPLALTFNTNQN